MTVYADVLIVLNILVDYFMLKATTVLLKRSPSLWRILLASALGGLSSLYIFLPQSFFITELAVRIVLCAAICFVCFGFVNLKKFLQSTVVFFSVNMGYAGAMLALWYILKPSGMVINNSVVYFDISPVFLIVFSVAAYILINLCRRLLSKNAPTAQSCKIRLSALGATTEISAIADSGNSLKDVFGCGEIIIAEEKYTDILFGSDRACEECALRYRALPCRTVTGTALLDGYRCDLAEISFDGKIRRFTNPILAISKQPLGGDYGAIIDPDILE